MKYYKVTMIRGHTGNGNMNGLITFYYSAENAIHAMNLAKRQGGVKHTRLPVSCLEVSKDEFDKEIKISAYTRAKVKKVQQ